MPAQAIDTAPIDKIIAGYTKLGAIDFNPLMLEWRTILEQDNRERSLAGQDGWGIPLAEVTYRPADPPPKKVDTSILANNNLTSSYYRTLTGPPLAPRGSESRIITNYVTASGRVGSQWQAIGAWKDVLSITDYPFLSAHFIGGGYLPIRDLRHIRPTAVARAKEALRAFAHRIVASIIKGGGP